jgi:hypothetical protein
LYWPFLVQTQNLPSGSQLSQVDHLQLRVLEVHAPLVLAESQPSLHVASSGSHVALLFSIVLRRQHPKTPLPRLQPQHRRKHLGQLLARLLLLTELHILHPQSEIAGELLGRAVQDEKDGALSAVRGGLDAQALAALLAQGVEVHLVGSIADVVAGFGAAGVQDVLKVAALFCDGGDFVAGEDLFALVLLELGNLLLQVEACFIACHGGVLCLCFRLVVLV